jgi:hypothetical protein
LILVLLVALALVGWQLLASRRADLMTYPALRMAGEVAIYATLVVGGVWWMLRPLHRRQGSNWMRWVGAVVAIGYPFLVALAGPAHQAHPASLEGVGADFASRAMACFLYGSVLALPFVLMAWASDRWDHRRLGRLLLVAAGGGVVGNFVLHLHCPLTDPMHILVGHALIGVAYAVVYAAIGLILVARRPKRV